MSTLCVAQVHNGAVPGTLSSYMSVCHNVHVPKDADIIFVEYSINDDWQVCAHHSLPRMSHDPHLHTCRFATTIMCSRMPISPQMGPCLPYAEVLVCMPFCLHLSCRACPPMQ